MSDYYLSGFDFGASVSPNPVQKDGGYVVTVTGAFQAGRYRVYVGPLKSAEDPQCYGGFSVGEFSTLANNQFVCVVPPLPVGGPYSFFLVNVDTGATITTAEVLDVVPHHFRSRVPGLRRVLPRHWKLGWRTVRAEEFPQ